MDGDPRDYAVGYGKPPTETQFQKGKSGNPRGRPRAKSLETLLCEALARPSVFVHPDGSSMTRAESIFAGMISDAEGTDPKAKQRLFDVLVKLHRADIAWLSHPMPEIEVSEDEDDAWSSAAAADR